MNEPPVREGDVLAGKYRVEKVLGVGGMGVVVAATHIQLEERVALKFLMKDALDSADAVARFAREARAAVKIKSEHVARVIDVGTLETGAPYMVMEYLEGRDLSQVIQIQGPLPPEDAVEYILQACEAIAHAHVLGIVHRDLKPANLFLIRRPDGTAAVKVLDFGISKVMPGKGSSSDNAMTRTRTVMGSPLYMSPEQMTSTRDVDGRTDIWALGVILYELLCGQPPFTADTMPQLCGLILSGPTPSIRTVRATIPAGLDAVLRHCMEKDPARRYPNIAEFTGALAEFAPRRARVSIDRVARVIQSASMTTSGVIVASTPGAQAQTGGSWADTKQGIHTKPSRMGVWVALVATAVLAVAAFFIARRSQVPVEATVVMQPTPGHAAVPPPTQLVPQETVPLAVAPATSSVANPSPSAQGTGPREAVPALAKPEPPRPGAKRPPVAPHTTATAAPAATPTTKPSDLFDDRK
jgi:eukaryotic-like serine/threonine-protein kinase